MRISFALRLAVLLALPASLIGVGACSKSMPSPSEFAAAWALIAALDDEALQAKEGKALEERWEGKRYTWTGTAVAGLCVDAKKMCAINVWDRAKTPGMEHIGGMFPLVHLSDAGWARLKEGCKGKQSCVATFDGHLSDVVAHPELPLALTFTDASIAATRDARADEQWFRSSLGGADKNALPKAARPEDATVPTFALQPRTF